MNNSRGWDAANIKPMANFNTIDEFWGMYQHMKRPNAMPDGTTINLFNCTTAIISTSTYDGEIENSSSAFLIQFVP